jgi:hypothetical protein
MVRNLRIDQIKEQSSVDCRAEIHQALLSSRVFNSISASQRQRQQLFKLDESYPLFPAIKMHKSRRGIHNILLATPRIYQL